MLTTDDIFNINDSSLNNSCNFNQVQQIHDGENLSDEDFLQQLSAELDIPLLLNQNDLDLHSDLLSTVLTNEPFSKNDAPDPNDNFSFMDWNCDILSTDIKLENFIPSSPESLYTNKSNSPTPSQSSDESRCSTEIKIKQELFETPPISPQEKIQKNFPEIHRKLVSQNRKNEKKALNSNRFIKQVPIKPKVIENVSIQNVKVVKTDPVQKIITPISSIIPQNNVVFINNVNAQKINTVLPNSFQIVSNDLDSKILKRQQRMIKNRESACLSRKKKKDYVTSLEKEIVQLKEENHKLKEENMQLRAKIFGKSTESITLKLPKSMKKSTAFLFAFIFMVSINVGSIGGLFNLSLQPDSFPDRSSLDSDQRHSRNLLWLTESEEDIMGEARKNQSSICSKQLVNQTESVRLAEELHRWIAKPYFNQTFNQKPKRRRKIQLKDTYSPSALWRSSFHRVSRRNRFPKDNEIEIFKPKPEMLYSDFFDAINRQDDTFYVVSFNSDNMLLPALHHNNTRRPKMSLLLPALIGNESSNTVSLMQIDCEVLNTRLLHVKSTRIPPHLRTTLNYTKSNYDFDSKYDTNTNTSHNFNKKYFTPYFLKNVTNLNNDDFINTKLKKKSNKFS